MSGFCEIVLISPRVFINHYLRTLKNITSDEKDFSQARRKCEEQRRIREICSLTLYLFISDGPVQVEVHPLSQRSTKAWTEMKVKQKHIKLKPMDPKTPITEDKLRFVCVSDTHAAIEKNPLNFVPDGDILVHAGDITNVGQPKEIEKFNEYLGWLFCFILLFY